LSSLYLCPIEFKEVKIIEDSFIIFSWNVLPLLPQSEWDFLEKNRIENMV
jgi:hypothetical protein